MNKDKEQEKEPVKKGPQVKQANPSVKKIETVRKPLHIRASFRQDSFNNKNLLMVIHRHWFGCLGMFIPGAAVFAGFFVIVASIKEDSSFGTLVDGGKLTWIGISLLIGAIFFYAIVGLIYFSNQLRLGQTTISQTTRTAFFTWRVSQLGLANIEDVTVEQQGFFANFFHFGNLLIETAGEQHNFEFRWCPQPRRCAQIILDTRDSYLDDHSEAANKVII